MTEDLLANQEAYRRYAKFYDFIFGRFLQNGRNTAIDLINKNTPQNAQLLEVGIGTGLSLPLYRPDIKVIGVDTSRDMLKIAHEKTAKLHMSDRVDLLLMDAEKLSFADASFNAVAALYVASVISDIKSFLDEVCRVCNSQGDIFILNHFASKEPIPSFIEKKLAKFHRTLGFHTDLSLDILLQYPQLKLVKMYNTNLFGYWKLLHFKKV